MKSLAAAFVRCSEASSFDLWEGHFSAKADGFCCGAVVPGETYPKSRP
jgi:hypothetical protein